MAQGSRLPAAGRSLAAPAIRRPASPARPLARLAELARTSHRFVAVATFVLALLPRLSGFDWQLPYALGNDPLKYYTWATLTAANAPREPTDFRNPSLFRHLLALEYRVIGAIRGPTRPLTTEDRSNATFRLAAQRVTVALLGAGAVAATALAAATLASPTVGLVAGGLLAFNYLHVHLSHVSTNDVPGSFFLALGLLFGVRACRRATHRDLLLAGLFAGLATAAKYNFGVVIVVPVAYVAIRAARRRLAPAMALERLVLLGAGGLAGLMIGMPEVVTATHEVIIGLQRQVEWGRREWPGQDSSPPPLFYAWTLATGAGWPALLLACLGLLGLLRARRARNGLTVSSRGLALAACPILLLLIMGQQRLQFARFALPLMPFVAIFAALGLAWIADRAAGRPHRAALIGLLLAAAILPPALDVVRLDQVIHQADTRVLAARWLATHLPPGTKIVAQSTGLPIARTGPGDGLEAYDVSRIYSISDPDHLQEYVCDGRRHLVLSSFDYDLHHLRSNPDEPPTGYELLERHAERLLTLEPSRDGGPIPYNPDNQPIPFWHLERFARPGSAIRVYYLPQREPFLCHGSGR